MENMLGSGVLPWVLMAGVAYFLMIRPKQKEAKEREVMLAALKEGDKISTYSGIIGIISKMDESSFQLKTGNSEIEFSKTAIHQKL